MSGKIVATRDTRFSELLKIPALSFQDVEKLYILRNSSDDNPGIEPHVDIGIGLGKDDRTLVFRALCSADKSLRLKTLELETKDDSRKYIRVTKSVNRKRKFLSWEPANERHIYVHFTLYKKGIENFNAIKRIAKCLGMAQSQLMIAGMKDRHAVTYQRCCFRVNTYNQEFQINICKRLTEAFPISDIGNTNCSMAIGALTFSTRPLSLGQLGGNLFSVCIRNFTVDGSTSAKDMKQVLKEREQHIRDGGFPNFFGSVSCTFKFEV